MNSDRGKTRDAIPGGQVGEGRLNQVSEFIGEETGDTSNWVEVYRTDDEWEVKLIQATLNAQQIRCRPLHLKKERQTALFVSPDHQVTALELVSQIDAVVTNSEIESLAEDRAAALKSRDLAVVKNSQQAVTAEDGEIVLAQLEDFGSVVYVAGHGYEIRVGPEPYFTVTENDWEEFTDYSAQRQEFVMLLRHEYPKLYDWIQEEKLLAEFIRLIEMTYQDGSPVPVLRQEYSETTDADATETVPIDVFAQLGIVITVISLIIVLFRVTWQVNLVFLVFVVLSCVIALFRIRMQAKRDTDAVKAGGVQIALLAIVLSCLVVVFSWWLDHRSEPDVPENPSASDQVGE